MAVDSNKKQRSMAATAPAQKLSLAAEAAEIDTLLQGNNNTRTLDWEDIDVYDEDDAQCCTEYVDDIFKYLRQKELTEAASPTYMAKQSDLTPKMRAILVDWMVDVHLKFKLLSETMFLSVYIVDRFLDLKEVSRHKLQLVGITAMLIGSKYEEIYSPEVSVL